MRIKRVQVRNLRCLADVSIDLDDVTVLIGQNGTGKSTLLYALQLFFEPRAQVDDEDWHNGTDHDGREGEHVEVAVTFADLPADLRERISEYCSHDGTLNATRRWTRDGSTTYVWARRSIPGAGDVLSAKTAGEAKPRYEQLQQSYPDLPAWSSFDKAKQALRVFEREHPEACDTEEAATANPAPPGDLDLRRRFSFVFVPAVREASEEAAEARDNALARLAGGVVAPTLESLRQELATLRDRTQAAYDETLTHRGPDALHRAQELLQSTLRRFYPTARLDVDWRETAVDVPEPAVRVRLGEHGFAQTVGKQGHGIQRAYLLALVVALAEGGHGGNAEDEPTTILAVEEPELYQHPPQARIFANALDRLGQSPGFQIVYATHSPLFVELSRLERVRVFRRREDAPSVEVHRIDREALAQASGRTLAKLDRQLRLLADSPVGEGLFASRVVLVEGVEDRAYVLGACETDGLDALAHGVSILPVNGKPNLRVPLELFRQLRIPTYVVFDTDSDKTGKDRKDHEKLNRAMLVACGFPDDDPFPKTMVGDVGTCLAPTLAKVARAEFGDSHWDTAFGAASAEYGGADDKNPLVVTDVLRHLREKGLSSATLTKLIGAIRQFASG